MTRSSASPSADSAEDGANATKAADSLRAALSLEGDPELALLLGSGMSGIAAAIEQRRAVSYSRIPGFAVPSIAGHPGEAYAGLLSGRRVLALAGRIHLYEGHPPASVAHQVRTLATAGARRLLICGAAGGISPLFEPGEVMIVADHIDLTMRSEPHSAQSPPRAASWPEAYDRELREVLTTSARRCGIAAYPGVYAGVLGPSYETAAEVRMLARLGADAVGMSTVLEVNAARSCGMRCAALSCITNRATGFAPVPLSHAQVLEIAAKIDSRLTSLIREFVASI